MKKIMTGLSIVILIVTLSGAQTAVSFSDHFENKAMRLELYMIGNSAEETIILGRICEEDIWPENPARLLEPFENGRYRLRIYDIASNKLIYSRGFDTMFGEYKTTGPALAGVKKVFKRSVRLPYPKKPVLAVIEARNRQNIPYPVFTEKIDPADYHIIKEKSPTGDYIYEAVINGDPKEKVDFLFIAEGYTVEDRDKFKADVDRFTGYLFEFEPYKIYRTAFNIRGLFRPSSERGMDEPRQRSYRNTVLDASFNAFDLDRYMLIEDGHKLRQLAGQVPYDTIVVLVNSKRYGGGGIYNDYCITTVDHSSSKQVFIHELGHSFAGLADEYYTSEVSYNDFYPQGVEPLEPNITALLDSEKLKWQNLVSPGIKIPTEYGKEEREKLQAERRTNFEQMNAAIEEARKKKLDEKEIKKIQKKFQDRDKAIQAKIQDVRNKYKDLEDKVGAFEGAGYAAKGLFRPMMYCLMISSPKNEFCLVCQKAIEKMIRNHTGE